MPSTFPQGIILFMFSVYNPLQMVIFESSPRRLRVPHSVVNISRRCHPAPRRRFPYGGGWRFLIGFPSTGPGSLSLSRTLRRTTVIAYGLGCCPPANSSRTSSLPASNSTERPGAESQRRGLISGRALGPDPLYCVFTTLRRTNDAF